MSGLRAAAHSLRCRSGCAQSVSCLPKCGLKRRECAVSLGVHSLCANEGEMLHNQTRGERARQRREPHHLGNEEPVDWPQNIQGKGPESWSLEDEEEAGISSGEKVQYI